jgi:transcriptional regulator with XRE-family HTH domain
MREALARRDITAVYRILVGQGVPQRQLAELVGQNQSEVSDILKGRQVQSYPVLERIAEGLGVSRGAMGMAYVGTDEGTPLYEDVTEDMRRRALLAAGTLALFGSPLLGEVLELPERPAFPPPLPKQRGAERIGPGSGGNVRLCRSRPCWTTGYGSAPVMLSSRTTRH